MHEVKLRYRLPPYGYGLRKFTDSDRSYAEIGCEIELEDSSVCFPLRAHIYDHDLPYAENKHQENGCWLYGGLLVETESWIAARSKIDIFTDRNQIYKPDNTTRHSESDVDNYRTATTVLNISEKLYDNLSEQSIRHQNSLTIHEDAKDRLFEIVSQYPTANDTYEKSEATELLSYLRRINHNSDANFNKFGIITTHLNGLYKRKDTNAQGYKTAHSILQSDVYNITSPTVYYQDPEPFPKSLAKDATTAD